MKDTVNYLQRAFIAGGKHAHGETLHDVTGKPNINPSFLEWIEPKSLEVITTSDLIHLDNGFYDKYSKEIKAKIKLAKGCVVKAQSEVDNLEIELLKLKDQYPLANHK